MTSWVAKDGDGFRWFYSDPKEAVFSGEWSTLSKGPSHITFYDSAPAPIPLPAAGWMLLAGVGGLAAVRRRKTA
ncbi:VPLPA-CTERM sorting domain-containing protein [Rhodovulum sp. ES.010]|uniref:VPLPA-CTERM sorting domain-containing protein n=1 Tax=Rhodovulum sp. ES.010 TaxID=1882821 RepID=UPI0020C9DFC0|nr:VPLPA-CTERM sorting domain-containing protein [Rhodovulum sp. ES.010]